MRLLRTMAVGWSLHFKQLSRSPFELWIVIASPIIFATLGTLIVSPANRVALFLGRALPVALNGVFVAAFAFTVGTVLLGVDVSAAGLGVLGLAIVVTAFSCTGLGLVCAAIGLRWRETAVVNNFVV